MQNDAGDLAFGGPLLHHYVQALGGVALMALPVLTIVYHVLSVALGLVTLLAGAFIGTHGVYRILKNRHRTGHW